MSYITVEEAKDYIGGISGGGDDVLLEALIDSAVAYIEGETGRVFKVSSDASKTFDAHLDVAGPVLYLGEQDLCAITSITNGDGVAVASDEYVTEPRRVTPYYAIRILSSADKSWTYSTDPEDAISISGRWGYSTTPPNDIIQACYDLVKALYRSRDANVEGGNVIISGGVVIQPADVPNITRRILARYKRL